MRFQVFEEGKRVGRFPLYGAYLFGTDGIGLRRTKITFRDGMIECKKPNLETAGLALLWPVDGFGRVLLPTTCLPERKKPYVLNVEIARAKMMQIINKCEDWSFFDTIEGLEDLSGEAQDLLIRAVQSISDPPVASQLADESLKKAMVFAEKLTIKQAESLFDARSKTHGFGRGCLGCRVDPSRMSDPRYADKLLDLFGFGTIPINWAQMEPRNGDFDFSAVDSCVESLGKKKMVIGAGPLLRFSKEYLPEWLLEKRAGFEKIRETAYQFISKVVSRYSGFVHRWYVVSGLNAFNHFGFNFEEILEMTRAANMAVRAASNRGLKIVEICGPWGEYYAATPNSIPPLVYIDMVVQSAINFDAFGLQVGFGRNRSGMHVRDMMQISAMLDRFGPIAKPLYVCDVGVPSGNSDGSHDGKVAGVWHEQWSQSCQSRWLEQFYRIALSKPFVDAVTYANLADTLGSAVAHSGLLTDRLEPKESFQALKRLRHTIFSR